MGIKCYCPHGHALHVKSHQAGKKGKCPKCGTKFQIPDVSAAEVSEVGSSSASEGDLARPDSPVAARPTPTAAPPSPPSGKPVVWYVRTREGHFGPTHEGAIREWISDGRITAGNWVWRDGWEEWRPAESVYPELQVAGGSVVTATASASVTGKNSATPRTSAAPVARTGTAAREKPEIAPEVTLPGPTSLVVEDTADPAGLAPGRVAARRRRVAKRRWTAVVVLSLASLALLIALVVVVRSS